MTYKKIRYWERREKGICTQCGINQTENGNARCEECKQKQKDADNYYLSRGICKRCHMNPVEDGKKICLDCKIKNRENARRYRKSNAEKIAENKKADSATRRIKRIENRQCTQCGKELPESYPRKICSFCLSKARYKNRRNYARNHAMMGNIHRSEWPKYGVCVRCGCRPTIDGKHVCKECHDVLAKQAEYARIYADTSYWKKTNMQRTGVGI